MIIEIIFYLLGSVYFLLSISILAVILIFTIKILRKAVSIEVEIKNTVSEAKDTVVEVKNKIASFSLGIAGIVALLEKLIDLNFKYRSKNKKDQPGKKENPANKEKREKKFAGEDDI